MTTTETTILVVDDDASTRQALLQVLKKEGYRMLTANSAMEALEKLDETSIDLLITDLRMERVDGIELMRRVRQRWQGIPVIVMTAFASIDTAIRSIHAGAHDYLSKPYEIDDLRLTVRRVLEQSRLSQGVSTSEPIDAEQDQ